MKKLLLSICIFSFAISYLYSQAPSYKDFEWDIIKLGYVIPGGDDYSDGRLVGGEFRLNLRDDLSIGLRTESVVFDHNFGEEIDVDATWSWAATSDYYWNTTSAYRAFTGIGFGSFRSGNITEDDGDIIITEGSTSTGILARIGYEYNHLRISAEYNMILEDNATNYFTLCAAFTLWGGYKGF